MKRILSIWLLSGLAALGSTVWCGQTATGNGSGADTNDLMSIATVNSSFPVGAGGQLNLCGVFTTPLTSIIAGSPGNPVTVYFEPGAKFSAPSWTVNGGTVINGASYVTIDGGVNGIIEATANGTGLAFSNNIGGILLSGVTGVTVKNLTIQNLYVNIAGPESPVNVINFVTMLQRGTVPPDPI